jgi:hypothetical protein
MRFIMLVVTIVLAGCSGTHLYNAHNQGLAQSATTSFAKADFDTFKKNRRANLNALHLRDIELAEDAAKATRDQAIIAVISGTTTDWSRLDKYLDGIDDDLAADTSTSRDTQGDPCTQGATKSSQVNARCVLSLENAQKQHRADLGASADGFRLEWRMEPPPCDAPLSFPDWANPDPPNDLPARLVAALKDITGPFLTTRQLTYTDYRQKCARVLSDITAEDAIFPTGTSWKSNSVPDFYLRIKNARKVYNDAVKSAADAADTLQKLQNALQAATDKKPGTTVASLAARVDDEIKKAMKDLEMAGSAVGIGKSAAAKAKLKAIDAFITALASPTNTASTPTVGSDTGLTPELANAAQILKTIPSLVDQVTAINATLTSPPLSALVIEKARQTALLDQANRTTSRAQQRVAILQATYDDRVEQLRQTLNARLERSAAQQAAATQQLARNYAAVDFYQIGVYLGQRAILLLNVNELDLEEQSAADRAEYAIDVYRAVLATPLNQFLAYEDAGIKPADLAKLIADIASAVGINIIAGKHF